MTDQEVVAAIHPAGEPRTTPDQTPEAVGSVDTFAGKVQVKWAPRRRSAAWDGCRSSSFLKTSGLLENWVQDCPLVYRSPNAPQKRDVLGTIL